MVETAAILQGGNQRCSDPRVDRWVRDLIFDRSFRFNAHLAHLLVVLDAAHNSALIREWVFSDVADPDRREPVLIEWAQTLPQAERLELFVEVFRRMELPASYLANEASHFRRTDFRHSRAIMLRAILAHPEAVAAAQLIGSLSAEAPYMSEQHPEWSAELKRGLRELIANAAAPDVVRDAARLELERMARFGY